MTTTFQPVIDRLVLPTVSSPRLQRTRPCHYERVTSTRDAWRAVESVASCPSGSSAAYICRGNTILLAAPGCPGTARRILPGIRAPTHPATHLSISTKASHLPLAGPASPLTREQRSALPRFEGGILGWSAVYVQEAPATPPCLFIYFWGCLRVLVPLLPKQLPRRRVNGSIAVLFERRRRLR